MWHVRVSIQHSYSVVSSEYESWTGQEKDHILHARRVVLAGFIISEY
jgi:hypothetical protein